MRFNHERAMRTFGVAIVTALPAATGAQRTHLAASPQPGGASFLERPAHLRVADVPLVDALRELERRSGVALAYSPSLLPAAARVTCSCDAASVRDALRALVVANGFSFRETDGQVMLFPSNAVPATAAHSDSTTAPAAPTDRPVPIVGPRLVRADSAVVSGRVTTEAGSPIASALVSIAALRVSATTNDAGAYRLVVPPDRVAARAETLHVVRLGFRPSNVVFTLGPGAINVDVAMTSQAVALEQVLVTGTAGRQERGAQAAVVASIDAADIMSKAAVTDVNELLYGRTAGVSMTTASGTSGANTRIDIRGQASVSLSNYPLVFIDGIRVLAGPRSVIAAPGGTTAGAGGQQFSALNDVNPDDIESIEIVKGPAAATLYGADASAGVIQILTKRGRIGSRRFNQKVTTEYDNIDPNFTPYDNFGKCSAALIAATSANPLCKGQTVGAVVSDNVLVRNAAFKHGWMGSVLYSANGGGENFGYYGSFGGENERGTTLGSFLNHRTGRVNFNWVAHPKVNVDASIGLVRADDRLPQGDQSSYGYLIGGDFGSPLTVSTAPDGSLAGGWFNNNLNVPAIGAIITEDNTQRTTPSVQMRFSQFPWLTHRLTMGADLARTTFFQMYPKNDKSWYSAIANTGSVAVTESNNTLYTIDYLGNASKRFGQNGWISSDLSFGSQWINTVSSAVSGTGQGLLTNSNNLVSAATTTTGAQSYGQAKSLGFIAQEQLGFNDRLYFQLGARLDRNSAFGSQVGSFFLPKVGVSYVMSQEAYWQRFASLVPTLRLRAAYGTTGRSPSGTAALQTYSRANFITDLGVLQPGVAPGSPGNADLKPERGVEVEAGLDAGFFGDRAGIELTYFNKTSRDLLLTQPLAPSSGFASSPLINIGEVVNRGLELSVRAAAIDRKNLRLDAQLNLNTLKNEITSMGNITPFINGNNQCFKPHIEVAAWCVPRVISVDTVAHRTTVSDTAEAVGGQLPKLSGSFNTTLTLFRNLRIFAQFDGRRDYKLYNLTRDFRDRSLANSGDVVLPADQGGYSAYERQRRLGPFFTQTTGAPIGTALVRDPYIVNGDFVRFRELSVTLSLPAALSQRLRVASSAISVGGRNLAVSKKYDGWDPEVVGVVDPATPFLADVFSTPQSRRVFVRLNLQY